MPPKLATAERCFPKGDFLTAKKCPKMKKSKRKNNIIKDALKQARKESREAEIKAHGKPINHTKIQV